METRKIQVKFATKESLAQVSKKLLKNSDLNLLGNTKIVSLINSSIDIKTRRFVKKKHKIPEYEKHWVDLVPFSLDDDEPFAKIDFYFDKTFGISDFEDIFEQKFTEKTKTIFYPQPGILGVNYLRGTTDRGNPQYPIYIISKGRSENCITADHLIKMGVPFNIVVEEQEIEDYARYYGYDRLITLDMSFKDAYDTYIPDFDETKSKGSGPARNFVWWHSKNVKKAKWHWIIDDNIFGFYYFTESKRIKAVDGGVFAGAEDFVNRYDNIGISGMNYYTFVIPGCKTKPYVVNTKLYSCILINNAVPIRWAGRYNEDVDICIRTLKTGYSTIQFDIFNSDKAPTQSFGGGNTDAFYAEEGTLPKSNQLAFNHPDITSVVWKFARWHHSTNYSIFDYYKDRTITETIQALNEHPVLFRDDIFDKLIISEIENINLKTTDWCILESLPLTKRNKILEVLKFYCFTNDINFIIDILTTPRILNCDLHSYQWNEPIEDTEDNRIMQDLLKLGNESDKLFYTVDWDSYLNYISEDKRNKIKQEMIKNKYLLKNDYPKFDYNLKIFPITEQEHKHYHDSKAYIQNEYFNENPKLPVPITNYDRKIRKEIKSSRGEFSSQLTFVHTNHTKSENPVTMICGDELFSDKKLFLNTLRAFDIKEIINLVNYNIDLTIANFALDNKIPNKNFVPNQLINGDGAYKITYKKMSGFADEAIVFCHSVLGENLLYLQSEFEKQNKKFTVVYEIKNNNLDNW